MKIVSQSLDNFVYIPEIDAWRCKRAPSGRYSKRDRRVWRKYICQNCQEEFLGANTSVGKFCSYKCCGEFKHKQALYKHGIMEDKRCSKCGQILSVDEFVLNKSGYRKGQYNACCKACSSNQTMNWKKRNPIRSKTLALLMRAKRIDKTCDLDYEWLYARFSEGHCEVTGIPFVFQQNGRPHRYSPSIDRIDAKKGYTKDNCRAVVWILNRAKGEDSDFDFEEFILEYADVINNREVVCPKKMN